MSAEQDPSGMKLESARILQNRTFKRVGGLIALLAALGFAPSYVKSATHHMLWSGLFNAPIARTTLLLIHVSCMPVWLLGVFVQIATGGTKFKRLHRATGYIAVSALAIGMCTAFGLQYRQWLALELDTFTFVWSEGFVIATCVNAALGINRAINKRTAEHKDCMLMTVFWSSDPAVRRLIVWLVRWSFPADVVNAQILWMSEIPWHFIMTACLAFMVVIANRVNVTTSVNVCLRLALSMMLAYQNITNVPDMMQADYLKATIACFTAFCLVMLTLVTVACRQQCPRRPSTVTPPSGATCEKV